MWLVRRLDVLDQSFAKHVIVRRVVQADVILPHCFRSGTMGHVPAIICADTSRMLLNDNAAHVVCFMVWQLSFGESSGLCVSCVQQFSSCNTRQLCAVADLSSDGFEGSRALDISVQRVVGEGGGLC